MCLQFITNSVGVGAPNEPHREKTCANDKGAGPRGTPHIKHGTDVPLE